jgi:hypothetical protein
MTALLFTFEDQNTGQLADIIAANESAARLRLGGIWINPERAPLWTSPSEIRDLPRVIKMAQEDERAAHTALVAANRMGKQRFTTPEALQRFNDAEETHRKAQARVRALIRISTAVQ